MHSISRILIFLAAFFLYVPRLFAQQPQDKEQSKVYLEQAQLMMDASQAFDDIREIMVIAADFDTTSIKAQFEAGHLYLKTIGKEQATKYFMRIYRQDPDFRFDLEYWIGQSYQYGLEFDKAIDFYTRYKDKLAKKPNYQGKDRVPLKDVDRRIFECQNGKEFVANPKNFSIVNIGREINSEYEDYAPVFNADQTELVFTTRRRDGNLNENVFDDNKPWEDIFYSKKQGGTWSRATNIGPPVNTPNHDSNLALSPDGKTLFIYKDDNAGDIFFCDRKPDGTWTAPEALPGIINSSYLESSVTISADGNTLYFASERPGGFGGLDIYMCTKDSKGEWSQVKNLGPGINTEYDEDGPFIDYDGKTLYFSSKGRKGMGGFDIFKSTLLNPNKNEWSEPENLGYPINTPDDDVYFVSTKDGKTAYYASVRDDGMGYSDIYRIEVPQEPKKPEPKPEPVAEEPKKEEPKIEEPVKEVPKPEPKKEEVKKEIAPLKFRVSVVDAQTKSPVDAKLKLQGAKDNVVVGATPVELGTTEFNITSATAKDYRLSVEREGYIFQNMVVRIEGGSDQAKTVNRTVELRKLVVGASSVLRNIYFDFGKASFKEESYNELNKLVTMMMQNTGMQVEISGHTDNVGSTSYNKKLSQLRANAVKNFLTSKGVDARRITAVGYGEEKPLASNDDEGEGREINRRVEFKVLGN
jgi:outer membrane protein OmpA-like peptidoglycan-associated protein/Tol biopolymer transport system component